MASIKLDERVAALEKDVARLKGLLDEKKAPQQPGWRKIVGSFANDPAFDQAMRLGRKWRESFRPKKSRKSIAPPR
jgi:hypothetical protein